MMQPVISAISTFDSLVVLAYLVAAVVVGLSVGRLTHVFSDEIGVPLHSYARWMRLVNAVCRFVELADGS